MSLSRHVALGLHKSAAEYKNALKRAGVRLVNDVGDFVSIMPISGEKKKLRVDIMEVQQLGYRDGATYRDICTRAEDLGCEICPAEVGPALMLDYPDQPLSEWIMIAMRPLDYGDVTPCIFRARRGDGEGARLYAITGSSEEHWGPYCKFVFVSPRQD